MEFTIENFISKKLLKNYLNNLKNGEILFEMNLYTENLKRTLVGVYDDENLIAIYYKSYKDGISSPSILLYGEIEFNQNFLKVRIFEKESFSIYITDDSVKNITPLIMKLLLTILDEKEKDYFNKEKNKESLESNLSLSLSFDSNRYFLYHKEFNQNEISGMLFLGDKVVYLFGDNRVFLEQKSLKEIELSTFYKDKKIKNINLKENEQELFIYSLSDFLFNKEPKDFIFDFKKLVNKTNDIIQSI